MKALSVDGNDEERLVFGMLSPAFHLFLRPSVRDIHDPARSGCLEAHRGAGALLASVALAVDRSH